jgi:hypothetical protein
VNFDENSVYLGTWSIFRLLRRMVRLYFVQLRLKGTETELL